MSLEQPSFKDTSVFRCLENSKHGDGSRLRWYFHDTRMSFIQYEVHIVTDRGATLRLMGGGGGGGGAAAPPPLLRGSHLHRSSHSRMKVW